MWFSTPSADSLTRPRLAVAVVSAVAAVSVGFYAYQTRTAALQDLPAGGSLHRSNAVRRTRRSRRTDTISSSSSEIAGDENADVQTNATATQLLADGPTIIEGSGDGDQWWDEPGQFSQQRTGHNIVNLLFRVSEDNARRNGCVHRGCQCNACGMFPIRGIRYRCANCADFDLCETCEAQGVHIKTHIFYKIKVPAPPFSPRQMQPVWYTGDPDTCHRALPKKLIATLTARTGFERPELEAFWEQWTFMAATEWRDDPDELGVAMDRKTFERCLVPTGGSRRAAPNLIHDRMFHFYDSNGDDLIGFTEFLDGLSYRKRKDKLRKVFEGYDIDADGYVNRRDFLRMFRAYYVLYKQMHKDILDCLEDQLLASTEAQQLVNSRQPLSSLFGREGRVPSGEGGMRFEGKTYRSNGSVDIADGYHSAIAEDKEDTASRQDILTSLFACDTDQHPPSRFVTGNDADSNWRTLRRMSGSDPSRTYAISLLDPPRTLSELPDVLIPDRDLQMEAFGDEEDDDMAVLRPVNSNEADEEDGNDVENTMTDSERRAMAISYTRRRAPRLEKRRRDMARSQLHERWRRRQFYLDEEEGGTAPENWQSDEDILVNLNEIAQGVKNGNQPFSGPRSRSSSKVRFADDADELEVQSNASTSSRSIPVPERWGGMELPFAERDAGKEILYQVTQQAFNELLDTIFKPSEDLAMEAARTKKDREKYNDLMETFDLDEPEVTKEPETVPEKSSSDEQYKHPRDKPLGQLLQETGYTVDGLDESPRRRNGVEISGPVREIHIDTDGNIFEEGHPRGSIEEEEFAPEDQGTRQINGIEVSHVEIAPMRSATAEAEADIETVVDQLVEAAVAAAEDGLTFEDILAINPEDENHSKEPEEYRDPTMPQFRPNSISPPSTRPAPVRVEDADDDDDLLSPKSGPESVKVELPPTPATLRRWKKLGIEETKAAERGGWGMLSFSEFEEIYKSQESQGNRLDYLGSWIDFCIP